MINPYQPAVFIMFVWAAVAEPFNSKGWENRGFVLQDDGEESHAGSAVQYTEGPQAAV